MKTLERLLLSHLRPKVQHAQDPLQIAYRTGVGVEDTILYLLHRAHSHLDKGAGTVGVFSWTSLLLSTQSSPSYYKTNCKLCKWTPT